MDCIELSWKITTKKAQRGEKKIKIIIIVKQIMVMWNDMAYKAYRNRGQDLCEPLDSIADFQLCTKNCTHCQCILTWTAVFSSIISTAMFLSDWSLCRCWRSWRVSSVSLSVLNASAKAQNLFCNTVPQPGTIIPIYHTTLASGDELSIVWTQ